MIIAPSILSADFGNLQESLSQVKSAKWIHVDVMDGHFVPNITIGPVVVKGLRSYTDQVLDTHLMIDNPLQYAKAFVEAGSDRITFHYEAVNDPLKVIREIKQLGVPVGISIKPKTDVKSLLTILEDVDLVLVMSVEPGFGGQSFMPEAVEKIKELTTLKKVVKNNYLIEVDGGINKNTAKLCKEAGVDVLVAGSYIFNSPNPESQIEDLR
ncbi:ribulose-phosphate 3-epimerase [Candidatus Xianfuyuplasma coldseepsis]|uniref:Ribulose-phosphate 3-epimerase n=1 Tax=Candidatus Xianfuyuplasma coldseepsis TaxID=2782163 RepID=A0A7L7KRY8_9MOLU|nr:ribulose-phosphate 3-epimerase [Xianfuyuplasma coldseepsis]QMS85581.1 ribulose-phosphate 3-epimerase [Xianfuyuplasma coldseepsis]